MVNLLEGQYFLFACFMAMQLAALSSHPYTSVSSEGSEVVELVSSCLSKGMW